MSSSNKIEQKTQYYSNVNSNYDTNMHEKSRQNPSYQPIGRTQYNPPNMYGSSNKGKKEITSMHVKNPLNGYSPVKKSRPSMHFEN